MSNEDGWNWVWQRFHGLDPHGIGDVSGDSGATGILGQQAPSTGQLGATSAPQASISASKDAPASDSPQLVLPKGLSGTPVGEDQTSPANYGPRIEAALSARSSGGILGPIASPKAKMAPESTDAPTSGSKGWSLLGYSSAIEAGVAGAKHYNPISISDNTERTGVVMGLPFLGYTYFSPTLNGPAGDTNPPGCLGCSLLYHTHGATDRRYDGENFSPADRGQAQAPKGGLSGPVPMVLGTPRGAIKIYDPVSGYEGPVDKYPRRNAR